MTPRAPESKLKQSISVPPRRSKKITELKSCITFILGFKQELYGYLLKYTRKLLETIVEARDNDPDAKELVQLVQNHTLGQDEDLGKDSECFV